MHAHHFDGWRLIGRGIGEREYAKLPRCSLRLNSYLDMDCALTGAVSMHKDSRLGEFKDQCFVAIRVRSGRLNRGLSMSRERQTGRKKNKATCHVVHMNTGIYSNVIPRQKRIARVMPRRVADYFW